MKKTISIIVSCVLILAVLFTLSACGEKSKFVGTWEEIKQNGETTGEVLVLANDGTGSVEDDGMSGSVKWSLDGDKVFLTASICGMTETTECSYEFSGDTMILTEEDGKENIYRKVN